MDFDPARRAFEAADLGRLCAELTRLFPHDPEIDRLEEMTRFALYGGAVPVDVSYATDLFLESMHCAGQHRRSGAPWQRRAHRSLPRDMDFIADTAGVAGWTLAQALNRIALDSLKASRLCAVVGTMRNDGIYIMEWIAHHLALGFEHFFIYTNDNSDHTDELLAALANHGLVTVMQSEITGEVPPEEKAFGHAMHLLLELRDFEWALFIDSDEYLVPAPRYDRSVANVVAAADAAHPQPRVGAICYDWLWFISDMIYERRPGLLSERFQHARTHWLSKCLVRIRDVQSMRRQHHAELAPGQITVDSAFQSIDVATIWDRRQAQYAGGRINHYWPRSFQEFAIKKARGATLGADNKIYDRNFDMFFAWNGYSNDANHYPTDQRMLQMTHERIALLRQLDGVAHAADRIEEDYPNVLARVASHHRLRRLYTRHRREPDDL